MLINQILAAERTDPGIWNSLPQLGWQALLQIEKEWRADLDTTNSRAWFKTYQKLRRAQQHTQEYKDFRRSILDRDGCCRKRGKGCLLEEKLQVHHKRSWFAFPELRMDPANCETQCAVCHAREDSSQWVASVLKREARRDARRKRAHPTGEAGVE